MVSDVKLSACVCQRNIGRMLVPETVHPIYRQVLTNLVTNALRHGRHGGDKADTTVEVRIDGGVDAKTERPFINVSDNGPGVPPEKRGQLFQPFHTTREDSSCTRRCCTVRLDSCNSSGVIWSIVP